MLRSSLDPLGLTTSSDTLGGGELSQVPMLRQTPAIGARTSKLKQPLARSEVTFSWIAEQMVHEVAYEIIMIWLGTEPVPWRVLDRNGRYKSTIGAQRLYEGTDKTTTT
jgi:hypothetical protein